MTAGVVLLVLLVGAAMIFLFTMDENAAKANHLVFVSETVRHGARAPETSDPTGNKWGFHVTDGQLTPQGMRQRHMLGRYHA